MFTFASSVSSQVSDTGAAGRRHGGRLIDYLIISSVNENLHNAMTRRETESKDLLATQDHSESTICLACHDRLMPHASGCRLITVDTDSLQQEEELRANTNMKKEEKQTKLETKKKPQSLRLPT